MLLAPKLACTIVFLVPSENFKCALFVVENCVVTGMYTRVFLNPYPSWTHNGNKILVRNLLRG